MEVVGWVRETGCIFCIDCLPEPAHPEKYDALFDGVGEWDYYPTCEKCKQEITDVQLTSDGIKWLNEGGRKAGWQRWEDAFCGVGASFYNAYKHDGNCYCLDCFIDTVLAGDRKRIADFRRAMQEDRLDTVEGLDGALNENTVQYESYPGQLLPLEGVYCVVCHEELYEPFPEEELSERG